MALRRQYSFFGQAFFQKTDQSDGLRCFKGGKAPLKGYEQARMALRRQSKKFFSPSLFFQKKAGGGSRGAEPPLMGAAGAYLMAMFSLPRRCFSLPRRAGQILTP